MSVFPFLYYMRMLVLIVLVVVMNDCLQTNYGDVKFVAVPSFMCVKFFC